MNIAMPAGLGAILALIALVLVIVLVVIGQMAFLPLGLILALLALSRLV